SIESLSVDEQVQVLKETVCNYSAVQHQAGALALAYAKDDVAGFLTVAESLQSPVPGLTEKFSKTLVADRNAVFAGNLAPVLESGNAMIAVGASHLYGEHGLLVHLQGSGFEVVPLNRNQLMNSLILEANTKMAQPVPALVTWVR